MMYKGLGPCLGAQELRRNWVNHVWVNHVKIWYIEYTTMETSKIGIREFREKLAGYLESDRPLAITRHGETLGFYIPAQKRSRAAELEAMRAAAKDLDEMIASWGTAEDELMSEYKQIRQSSREKKRNAKQRVGG